MTPDRKVTISVFLSLLAPGLGHLYCGKWLEAIGFAGTTVAIGMLGTVAVLASPFLAWSALVGAMAAWIAVWIAASASVLREARGSDARAAPALRGPRWRYSLVLLAVITSSSIAMWAIAVRERVAEVFRVPSRSMEPAIAAGSHVIVDKLAYRKGPVRRGDVVVFVNPNERSQSYIKRVVALPRDVVEIRGDDVFVNGSSLAHDDEVHAPDGARILRETNAGAAYRIELSPNDDGAPTASIPIRVPNGSCFLLGDNRRRSVDSREVGPVPLADVIGKVARVW
jgi:signal peptidase I